MKKIKHTKHLPLYGVGPFYGAGIVVLTILGGILSFRGDLVRGQVIERTVSLMMILFGIVCIIGGFLVWKSAAIGDKSVDIYIKRNVLCTTGVYRIVRNPCYSGIMFFCTGVLLLFCNLWLLILPFIYWGAMTVLMKNTEEKWLLKQYGKEYRDYCKSVNRCIPWFPKKQK